MKASGKYRRSKFTTCNFEVFSDGTQMISMYDPEAEGKKHLTFRVKNLNRIDEEILEDEGE